MAGHWRDVAADGPELEEPEPPKPDDGSLGTLAQASADGQLVALAEGPADEPVGMMAQLQDLRDSASSIGDRRILQVIDTALRRENKARLGRWSAGEQVDLAMVKQRREEAQKWHAIRQASARTTAAISLLKDEKLKLQALAEKVKSAKSAALAEAAKQAEKDRLAKLSLEMDTVDFDALKKPSTAFASRKMVFERIMRHPPALEGVDFDHLSRHFGKWDDQQLAKTMNATIYAERFSNVMKELHTRRKHGNDAAVVAWWKKVL